MKLNITPDMKQAAKNVIAAQAVVKTIHPIVHAYQVLILNEMQVSDRYDGKLITEPKLAWTMSDDDFLVYMKRQNEEQAKAGLKTDSPEHCPLLCAQEVLRLAERHLVDVTLPLHRIKADDALCAPNGLTIYRELIDLTLGLIVPRM